MHGVTVCIIAKDEERDIARCINSTDFANEVLVVDTGSTDRTIEIAKECGATVKQFKWCDDFSAARNYGMEQAKHDWVFMLDADEEIIGGEDWAEAVGDEPGVSVPLSVSMTGDHRKNETFPATRLLKSHMRFEGIIHERVDFITTDLTVKHVETPTINHFGPQFDSDEEITERRKRNLKLLRKALFKDSTDAYLWYHLASELAHFRLWKPARAALVECIEHKPDDLVSFMPPAYRDLARSYCELKDMDEGAFLARQAQLIYPDYTDLVFVEAACRSGREQEWLLRKCLRMGETNKYQTWAGVGSWQAQESLQINLDHQAKNPAQNPRIANLLGQVESFAATL